MIRRFPASSIAVLTLTASLAWSSSAPRVYALNAPVNGASIRSSIQRDLEKAHHLSFAALMKDWESRYGTRAVSPLLELAALHSLQDHERYAALMGAARLGGTASAPLLTPFLKDSSWMLRSGALRAISALGNPETRSAPLKLIQDPALVVRLEAVESIEKLRPAGASDALLSAIASPDNYHARRALWVPERALQALLKIGEPRAIAKLSRVAPRIPDRELRAKVLKIAKERAPRLN